jgi:hypothetical protein
LHIRQGELALSQFKDRYLGLEYFEQVLRLIIPTLSQSQIPHELIVCTESNQEKLLPASDIKIIESIRLDPLNPNLIKVDDKHFKVVHEKPTTSDTPLLTQCKWSEGQGAYSDFLTFLNADILVLSKSSFSYLAALLNPNALVIYPDFWHPPLSTWVSTKDEATLLSRLRTKIRHRSSLKN